MRQFLVLAFLAVLTLTAPQAFAHAFPAHSQPAVGSTVTQLPKEVSIWFTEKLEPAFSHVEVVNAGGAQVDNGDAQVDAHDPTLLHVSLKPLLAGIYKVEWHVVSVDTHPTQGDFIFTVR